MIIIPIGKLTRLFSRWRKLFIFICILCLGIILLYVYYAPFRDYVNQYLPKHIISRIIDFLIPTLVGTIFAIFLSGSKKQKEVLIKNSRRLGLTFQKTDEGYIGNYKGRKISYSFSGGKEDHDNAEFVFFHQRPLNLGLFLIINQSKYKLWILNLRLFITQDFISNRIMLPVQLLDQGINCWASEGTITKQLMLNSKITNPLSQLNELVKNYKGHFQIDDESITMQFPFDTLLDNTILEIAYQLSSGFSNSIMLPQQMSRYLTIRKAFYKAAYSLVIIALIVYWGWDTVTKLYK
jgi:hypothetical protein